MGVRDGSVVESMELELVAWVAVSGSSEEVTMFLVA